MDEPALRQLLDDVRAGVVAPDDAVARLRRLPFADLGFARVDHHRALRQRAGEAVYAPGQDAPRSAPRSSPSCWPSRRRPGAADPGRRRPGGAPPWRRRPGERSPATGSLATRGAGGPLPSAPGGCVVVTAGTADLPVADECVAVLAGLRLRADRARDRLRGGRRAPAAGLGRRAGRGRRRRGGGRHGGCAGQPGGRHHRRAGRGRARVDAGTAPPSKASPPCWPCTRRAPPGSPWWASTTASAPPAPWPDAAVSAARARRRPSAGGPTSAAGHRHVAWFHCFAGIAGDMALGSLLDAGADLDEVLALLERLPSPGWGLRGRARAAGRASPPPGLWSRPPTTSWSAPTPTSWGWSRRPGCPTGWRARALATFAALAEVEGRLHRRPPDQVHFHEVGGHDTDHRRGRHRRRARGARRRRGDGVGGGHRDGHGAHRPRLAAQPVAGRGRVCCGASRPRAGTSPVELTTPTGAAILAAMAPRFGPLPPMRIASTGLRGRERTSSTACPTAPRWWSGEPASAGPCAGPAGGRCSRPTSTTPPARRWPTPSQALLDAGAHDAWITPVVMKKGRPGHTVSALADPALADAVRAVLEAETGTLGVRGAVLERWPATTGMDEVEVDGAPVRVKVSPGRVKVEQADAARAAARHRRSVARRAVPGRDGLASPRRGAHRRRPHHTHSARGTGAGVAACVSEFDAVPRYRGG